MKTKRQIRLQYEKEIRWFKAHESECTALAREIYRARMRVFQWVLRKAAGK